MPNRDTFTMALVPVPQVIFPGVVSMVALRPRNAGAAARLATAKDQSLVFSLTKKDQEPTTTMACTGRILVMDEMADGWQLTVAGIQRAQILTYRHQGNTLIGQFRYASESEEAIPELLREEAWALASELWAMIDSQHEKPALPQIAPLLSYWIAAHVPLNLSTQQELLEIPSTRGRLAKEIALMRTLLDGLRTEHSS